MSLVSFHELQLGLFFMMIFKRFIGLCTKISRDEKILGHHSNVLLRQKSYWDGKKIRVVRSNTLLCQKIYWDGDLLEPSF